MKRWTPIEIGPFVNSTVDGLVVETMAYGPNRANVLHWIAAERERQIEKWGTQRHTHLYWLGILMEEIGEVAKAIIERQPWEEIQKELIQAAAVIVAWLESNETGDIVPETADEDALFISYLRGESSEGYAAGLLGVDRVSFRKALGDWLGIMLAEAPVPVDGWRRES